MKLGVTMALGKLEKVMGTEGTAGKDVTARTEGIVNAPGQCRVSLLVLYI